MIKPKGFRNIMNQYKKKYPKIKHDIRHYADFIDNETPVHQLNIEKRGEVLTIALYVGSVDFGESFSIWAYIYKNGDLSEGQFINVRFNYGFNKLILGQRVNQWSPKTSWYFRNAIHGFVTKQIKGDCLMSDIEIIDIVQCFLEEFPQYDFRINRKYANEEAIENLYPEYHSNIYLILDETHKTIKLGESTNYKRRFNQINSDTSSKIRIVGTLFSKHAKILDSLLKNHYKYKCLKGEWFHLTDNDLERIFSKSLPHPISNLIQEVQLFK
jgi:hypothetical protein